MSKSRHATNGRLAIRGAAAVLLALPLKGWGFDLASDQNLTGNPSVLVGVGAGNAITNRPITGGNLYDWADVNGDGVRGDAVSIPGLNLGGYKLYNSSGSHIVLDLAGGDIAGTGTVAMATSSGSGSSGRIEIRTTNDVDCGGLMTTPASGSGNFMGDILIGSTGSRAGNVRVGFLDIHRDGHDVSPGVIAVYGTGHVRVRDGGGALGDILTWTLRNNYQSVPDSAGSVTVVHDGEFLARNIYTYHTGDNFSKGGHVTLDGDGAGNGASGVCTVTNIYTYSLCGDIYGGRGGNVTIRGYSGVRVGNIDTRSYHLNENAGNVTITNIAGNIDMTGALDLRNGSTAWRSGNLVLAASGRIAFRNLDLSRVLTATVSSPAGIFIEGTLSNFPVTASTNGLLNAPAGITVNYNSKVPGNAYLGGNTYLLKSGGRLRSETRGTVVIFR